MGGWLVGIVSIDPLTKTMLFILILASHALFFAYFIYHFMQQLRKQIRERFTKVYVALFLCCSEKKLKQEMAVEGYLAKLEPYLNKFDEVQQCKVQVAFSLILDLH